MKLQTARLLAYDLWALLASKWLISTLNSSDHGTATSMAFGPLFPLLLRHLDRVHSEREERRRAGQSNNPAEGLDLLHGTLVFQAGSTSLANPSVNAMRTIARA